MKYGDIVVYKDKIGKVVTTYGKKDECRFLPCNYGRYYSEKLDVITDETVRAATHDEKLELIREEYTWGTVKDIHCIGDYQIVEAIDKKGKTHFHGYINYGDINISYSSLDSALIGMVCYKYEGGNERLSGYIGRILNINGKESE